MKSYSLFYAKIPSNSICNLITKPEHILQEETFFQKLEESILKEGFRNPIFVSTAFYLEKSTFRGHHLFSCKKCLDYVKDNMVYLCKTNGGSRLYVAQKHNLEIPCIILDWTKTLDFEILKTQQDIRSKFKDKPKKFIFNEWGFYPHKMPKWRM